MKPRLLDLFCGAGGAAMGYYRAGFDVVGVDIDPQPHWPWGAESFKQGGALGWAERLLYDMSGEYDAVHASPPCQAYTAAQNIRKNADSHPELLVATRELLKAVGLPFVIENVEGAPLQAQVMLCGTMFGLKILRHRWFEANWSMTLPPVDCNHDEDSYGEIFDPWHGDGRTADKFREAMGIDWMPIGGGANRRDGRVSRTGTINEAIPPAYTEWIGRQLIAVLDRTAEVSA